MSTSVIKTFAALLSLAIASTSFAHIRILSPNGGEVLEVGSTYAITWKIVIPHNQLNWDVFYSTASANGPWTTVALNLAPGSPAVNSIHTYNWTIPNAVNSTAWVRVIMDNAGTDYNDVNDAPFAIVPAVCNGDSNGDGFVNVTDLLSVIDQWGMFKSPADLNSDGLVNVTDLLIVVGNWGACI